MRARAGASGSAAPLWRSASGVSRQKGQDVLVEAWREVEARVPGAELVLVGSGPEEAALRAGRASSETRDVRDWLAAANVVVQPSAGRASRTPSSRRWPARGRSSRPTWRE